MELDELKTNWQQLNNTSETATINPKIFTAMRKRKLYAGLKKIIVPEILGSAVCIAAAVYIMIHFNKLDTIAFQLTGLLTITLLLVLPILSLLSLYQLYKTSNLHQSYATALREFSTGKIKFCKLQKLNLMLSYLLLVAMVILATRIFGSNHLTESKSFWIITISAGYIFLTFFSKWVSRSYNKTIRHTETILKDFLEEIN